MRSSCSTVRPPPIPPRLRPADIGPALAGVVLGLATALSWGGADFTGGSVSRRAPVVGVILGNELVGIALAVAILIWRGEAAPSLTDLALIVAAGLLTGVGILALYTGLAVGRMSVVAPIAGLLTAAIPVVIGSILDGIPGTTVLIGFVIAIAAVILVSRSGADRGSDRSGFGYAVAAGTCFGIFAVLLAQIGDDLVAGPLVVIRLVAVAVMVVVVIGGRQPWRIGRPLWPVVALIGILDAIGNLCFIASIQAYRLDVAATLSSLYPIVTVVLAAIVLRERIVGGHAVGIGLAAVAIVLIAGGSTV